jgi:hypothetical protein
MFAVKPLGFVIATKAKSTLTSPKLGNPISQGEALLSEVGELVWITQLPKPFGSFKHFFKHT